MPKKKTKKKIDWFSATIKEDWRPFNCMELAKKENEELDRLNAYLICDWTKKERENTILKWSLIILIPLSFLAGIWFTYERIEPVCVAKDRVVCFYQVK